MAPGTSHLLMFRIVYGFDTEAFTIDDKSQGFTTLQIEFKTGEHYEFYTRPNSSYTTDRLETIFHMMESDERPGEIVWRALIEEKWDYKRLGNGFLLTSVISLAYCSFWLSSLR